MSQKTQNLELQDSFQGQHRETDLFGSIHVSQTSAIADKSKVDKEYANDDMRTITTHVSDNPQPFTVDITLDSRIKDHKCFCDKLESYPRNWPTIYMIHQICKYLVKSISLIIDFILFVDIIDWSEFDIKTNRGSNPARYVLTIIPGILTALILCIALGNTIRKNFNLVIAIIAFIFVIPIAAFFGLFYKIFLSLFTIGKGILLLRLHNKRIISANIQDDDLGVNSALLIESIASGWPLFVITLVDFQYQIEGNNNWNTFAYLAFIKILASALEIAIYAEKIRPWWKFVPDPERCEVKCNSLQHHIKPQSMRLLSDGNLGKMKQCRSCETVLKEYYFYCDYADCDNYLCMRCSWELFLDYKKVNDWSQLGLIKHLTKNMKMACIDENIDINTDNVNDEDKYFDERSIKTDRKYYRHGITLTLYIWLYFFLNIFDTNINNHTLQRVCINKEFGNNWLLIDTVYIIYISIWFASVTIILGTLLEFCPNNAIIKFIVKWCAICLHVCSWFGMIMAIIEFDTFWNDFNFSVKLSLIMFSLQIILITCIIIIYIFIGNGLRTSKYLRVLHTTLYLPKQ